MHEDQIRALADLNGIDPVGYDRCLAFARSIFESTKELCAQAAEKEVTMEGYEKEIARSIRTLSIKE